MLVGFPKSYAAQLQRGEQIQHIGHHHAGMEELKRQLGDPRLPGRTASGKRPLYTLSLVNPDSPSAYDGHGGYRLSTDPADYVWETWSQNVMRKSFAVRRRGGVSAAEWHRTSEARRAAAVYGARSKIWWDSLEGQAEAVRRSYMMPH